MAMASYKDKNYPCKTCHSSFTTSSNLYRHTRKVHGDKVEYVKCHKKCLTCGECFNNRKLLTDHVATVHKFKIETIKRSFNSLKDFEEWKFAEETRTGNFYSRSHRYFNQAKNFVSSLYVCHRDGNYKSINTGIRALKRQGSCKINATCPSIIKLKMNSKTLKCSIEYIPNHLGHDSEPVHTRVPKFQRNLIAEKVKENIPVSKIVEEVNNQIPETLKQLTTKDVRNIKATVAMEKPETQLDSDDHTSVGKWAERLQDQVLYYKPKSEPENEFILIWQRTEQVCKDPVVVWVGDIKDLVYEYYLVSVLAVDEYGERFPVAQMITSTINEATLTQLYSCIKSRHGVIHCSHFMTKNFGSFAAPWETVMRSKCNKILCSWNVDEFWKMKLNLNHDECKNLHKDLLYLLQKEENVESFQQKMEKIVERIKIIPRLKEYKELILKYLRHRQTWAKCFKFGIHENTDKSIICFEKRLRKICFDGKVAGRLDTTLLSLHKFISESRKLDTSFKAVMERIRVAHRESLRFAGVKVESVDDFWTVQVRRSLRYEVRRNMDECSCNIRCKICNICQHSLKCDCTSWGRNVICSHMHAVARIFALKPDGVENSEEHSCEEVSSDDDSSSSEDNEDSQDDDDFHDDDDLHSDVDDLQEIFPENLEILDESIDEIDDPIESNPLNEKDVIIQEKMSSIVKLCVEKLPHASEDFVSQFIKDLQTMENSLLAIKKRGEVKSESSSRRKMKHTVRTELSGDFDIEDVDML